MPGGIGPRNPEKVGRYTIVGEIGRGGMGVVYEAEDPDLGRRVAIKLIRFPHDVTDDKRTLLEERFRREARSAGQIHHPGVVTIYDIGREGEFLFLVMELVTGESLAEQIDQGRYPNHRDALELAAAVADALAAAHQAGVVHRDIKPENIMIDPGGGIRVTDFGVAKGVGEFTSTLTRTGMIVGSPAYMSPEQVANDPIDTRADIFSLGAVLFQLLYRRKPFAAQDLPPLLYQIVHGDPFEEVADEEVASPVVGLLKQCLSKEPDQRPDAVGFAAEARRLAAERPGQRERAVTVVTELPSDIGKKRSRKPPPTKPTKSPPTPRRSESIEPARQEAAAAAVAPPVPPKRTKRIGWGWIAAALLALGAVGLVSLWFSRQPDDGTRRDMASPPVGDETALGRVAEAPPVAVPEPESGEVAAAVESEEPLLPAEEPPAASREDEGIAFPAEPPEPEPMEVDEVPAVEVPAAPPPAARPTAEELEIGRLRERLDAPGEDLEQRRQWAQRLAELAPGDERIESVQAEDRDLAADAARQAAGAGNAELLDKVWSDYGRWWPGDSVAAQLAAESRALLDETLQAAVETAEEVVALDPAEKVGLTFVTIPAGSFVRGCTTGDLNCLDNEKPSIRITISRSFEITRTEVTNQQFLACVEEGACSEHPSQRSLRNAAYGRYPVANVSWGDAAAFCRWVSGRLPTEAEWEYAARGGKTDWRYPWGNEITREQANYAGRGGHDRWVGEAPVGSFVENGFGLLDIAGNVAEWVADYYQDDYYWNSPRTDPTGPGQGGFRVVRGGSWYDDPLVLRVSMRLRHGLKYRRERIGFRCAR